MRIIIPTILFICILAGCKPTAHDFMNESNQAFQPYVTGDIQAAKAALLAEEKVIAKYEADHTPDYDFHHAYLITYGRLCAVYIHLGDTNHANEYFHRAIAHRILKNEHPTGAVPMDGLLAEISKLDAPINPKWRQAK